MKIHPAAIVHPKADLADDVEVGPFCVIGENVSIGKGTKLLSHVTIDGWTEIGDRNVIFPFASIGGPPQHLGYKGEPTKVIIGDDNVIREYVTVNRATGANLVVRSDEGFQPDVINRVEQLTTITRLVRNRIPREVTESTDIEAVVIGIPRLFASTRGREVLDVHEGSPLDTVVGEVSFVAEAEGTGKAELPS